MKLEVIDDRLAVLKCILHVTFDHVIEDHSGF